MSTSGKKSDSPRPKKAPTIPEGVRADCAYPLRGLERALGWQRKTSRHALQAGLKSVMFGRQRFVLGRWVLEFFERLESEPDGAVTEGNLK